jgi:hypothetical protein
MEIRRVPTKRKVGRMKAAPVSLTPRMLTRARAARMKRQRERVCGSSHCWSETIASTPAEMPTAAVRM